MSFTTRPSPNPHPVVYATSHAAVRDEGLRRPPAQRYYVSGDLHEGLFVADLTAAVQLADRYTADCLDYERDMAVQDAEDRAAGAEDWR